MLILFPFLCGDFRISWRSIAFVINQSQCENSYIVDEEIVRQSDSRSFTPKCSQLHTIVCPSSLDRHLGKNDDCHASSPCSVGVCGVDA